MLCALRFMRGIFYAYTSAGLLRQWVWRVSSRARVTICKNITEFAFHLLTTIHTGRASDHRSDPSAHHLILPRVFSATCVHGGLQRAFPPSHVSRLWYGIRYLRLRFLSFMASSVTPSQAGKHERGIGGLQRRTSAECRVTPSTNLAKLTFHACP
jgi:hypothetical protein